MLGGNYLYLPPYSFEHKLNCSVIKNMMSNVYLIYITANSDLKFYLGLGITTIFFKSTKIINMASIKRRCAHCQASGRSKIILQQSLNAICCAICVVFSDV